MEKSGNMFYGSFSHNLDEKGRLVIPRKMREQLGSKIFIMKGFDGALAIYKEESFNALIEELESLPKNFKSSRDYTRHQLASVCDLDVDKLGRVQIPTQLLTKYHISKNVIVIGAGDHIEVWDSKAYAEYEAKVDENFEEIAEHLYDKE